MVRNIIIKKKNVFQNLELAYQSKEDEQLARAESMLPKIDELLSAPNLSNQQRTDYLSMKCEVLSIKIRVEESISPLFDDVINYSQVGVRLWRLIPH
ncbi:hypothetical protein Hanom_Chr01g00034611 [Helianthus anomalus]